MKILTLKQRCHDQFRWHLIWAMYLNCDYLVTFWSVVISRFLLAFFSVGAKNKSRIISSRDHFAKMLTRDHIWDKAEDPTRFRLRIFFLDKSQALEFWDFFFDIKLLGLLLVRLDRKFWVRGGFVIEFLNQFLFILIIKLILQIRLHLDYVR